MANLKSLLPVVTVPPLTTTVLGSSQQLTATGSYYIDGAYNIILPPVGDFSKGDVVTLTPKLNYVSTATGDTATDILTKFGTTDFITFNERITLSFVHNGLQWEV